MTEPVFDENGWCSDMTLAPYDVNIFFWIPDDGIRAASWINWYDHIKEVERVGWRCPHSLDILGTPSHWKPYGEPPLVT